MALTADQVASQQIALAQSQADAAWSAAQAAWLQAWLTPLSILVGLLTAVGVPLVARMVEKRRLALLAIQAAAEAAGAVAVLAPIARLSLEQEFKAPPTTPLTSLRRAREALQAVPRDRLGNTEIDSQLRLLSLKLVSAEHMAELMLDAISKKQMNPDAIPELEQIGKEAADCWFNIAAAAKVKVDKPDL